MLVVGSLFFFVSGFSALTYQVVWQRLLGLFSGADVYAATIVVGAFMGGLGVGGLAGGSLADRLSRRANLVAFALAECAVGLFGFFSVFLYYELLYLKFGELVAPAAAVPVVFISLLWPTFFMGMSLPLLTRALTRAIEHAAPTVGLLYGLNTLGASAGALLTTWWLLPNFGLAGSSRIGAALNLAVGLIAALLVARSGVLEGNPLVESRGKAAYTPSGGLSFPVWIGLYGLAGFLALSLEIVWFRAMGVIVKSTAFTFGTMLAVYLAGLGLGASIGSLLARQARGPAIAFLLMQVAIGLYVGLSIILLLSGLQGPPSTWLSAYLAQYDPLDVRGALLEGRAELLWLYLGIPAALIGPPTFLMGASFPMLQKVVQTDFARLGSRVGALMFANIVGSTLGAIITGWLSLRLLGTAGTLKATVLAAGTFAVVSLLLALRPPARRWRWAAASLLTAAALSALVAAMPGARPLWAGLHAVVPGRIVYGEDETGLSLLKLPEGAIGGRTLVFMNGVGQSWLPYGDIHTVLGALPAFVHPDPRDVAVIGLGSGDTAFGIGGRHGIERITSIEIVRSQLATLRQFDSVLGYRGLKVLLEDPRIEHVTGDGRLYLMRTDRRFDIIEADALRPGSAYAGNLYSDRYFMLLRDRLKPGGLAVTWAPTPRVKNTFLKVFPHVLSYGDVLLGSREPIDDRVDPIRARLADHRVRDYYAEAGVDIRQLLDRYIAQPERYGENERRSASAEINTDMFPRDEFDLPPLSQWGSQSPRVTD
jgi:predicted membrane-bound spermidine synthase